MNTNGTNSGRDAVATPADQWPSDEAEVIRREAERALAMVRATVEQLKPSLKTAADVRLWTQHHPWLSVGVAAAAGFVLANQVFSGADGAGAGQMAEGASAGRPPRAPEPGPHETGGAQRASGGGMLMGLLRDAVAMLTAAAIRAGTEAYVAKTEGAAHPGGQPTTSPPSPTTA